MRQAALAVDGHSEVDPDQNQYLTFKLSGETYAVSILRLREIIDFTELTNVPLVPQFIRGVLNLRGRVVPVIDLAVRFSSRPSEVGKRTSIVIAEVSDGDELIEVGIIVDGVNDVLEIPHSEIEPAPSFGLQIRTDFILGMGKVNDSFLVLLDIDKVLSVEELAQLSDVSSGKQEQQPEIVSQGDNLVNDCSD